MYITHTECNDTLFEKELSFLLALKPNLFKPSTDSVGIQCELSFYLKKAGLASRNIVHH